MSKCEVMKVAVCVATRGRPQMLAHALRSLTRMVRPPAVELVFAVIENDFAPRSRAVVEAMRPSFDGSELHYLVEESVGIPVARNRAIDFAEQISAHVLAFIDDDEVVDGGWLVELVSAYQASGALLLGGPVLAAAAPKGAVLKQKFVHSALARRYLRKMKRARRLSMTGRDARVTITTGNWLGSTELFTHHGLRFNEQMRFSGGSDAAFFAEVRERGLPVKWVPTAVVYETIPGERLDTGYQFRRALDQSTTSFHRKLRKSKLHALSLIVTLPLRALAVAVLAVAIIPTGGLTYLPALRGAGWMAGRIAAVCGRESTLYAQITGN